MNRADFEHSAKSQVILPENLYCFSNTSNDKPGSPLYLSVCLIAEQVYLQKQAKRLWKNLLQIRSVISETFSRYLQIPVNLFWHLRPGVIVIAAPLKTIKNVQCYR